MIIEAVVDPFEPPVPSKVTSGPGHQVCVVVRARRAEGGSESPSRYLRIKFVNSSGRLLTKSARSTLRATKTVRCGGMKQTPTIEKGLGTFIITGSSGRIGSSFIDRIGESYTEMGFDREGPPHPPPDTEHVIDCDLSSDESVQAALDKVRRLGHKRITSVIHLAAYYSFSGEPSPLYEQVTVRGTERLLHGLRDFEVEQFIFSSTMLVHAPCEPGESSTKIGRSSRNGSIPNRRSRPSN